MSRALLLVPTCSMISRFLPMHWRANSLAVSTSASTLGVGLGGRVDLGEVRVVVVDAVDRWVALAGAAWIPADDVEPIEQRAIEDLGGEERQVGAAEARVHRD